MMKMYENKNQKNYHQKQNTSKFYTTVNSHCSTQLFTFIRLKNSKCCIWKLWTMLIPQTSLTGLIQVILLTDLALSSSKFCRNIFESWYFLQLPSVITQDLSWLTIMPLTAIKKGIGGERHFIMVSLSLQAGCSWEQRRKRAPSQQWSDKISVTRYAIPRASFYLLISLFCYRPWNVTAFKTEKTTCCFWVSQSNSPTDQLVKDTPLPPQVSSSLYPPTFSVDLTLQGGVSGL